MRKSLETAVGRMDAGYEDRWRTGNENTLRALKRHLLIGRSLFIAREGGDGMVLVVSDKICLILSSAPRPHLKGSVIL